MKPMEDIFSELLELDTDRMLLREINKEDAVDIFAYASDYDVAKETMWKQHETIEDSYDYIEHVKKSFEERKSITWGIVHKEDHKLIGACGFGVLNESDHMGEIGYVLSKVYWGEGYAPEAVEAMIKYGFEEMGLNRIQARCSKTNPSSERVMQKVGMEYEGTLRQNKYVNGQYIDKKMYSILREDWNSIQL
ncbi:GNAT family N-acetyltransferase [Pseudalkalibacillus caeni]|uniref:GNAT family N-acetyltransferase n=1 Tax=Exobacillus caeni TaxID=2574798 RepID=A0A5R9F3L6_9BACL|nr:GNAT family protein [Pseudalkalibacillus caeni]TLS38197.1 GNAT family N-acetyltransferase [Pseudalkalibacillus caeni]